jgi:Domain of unknown function (DUF5615)
LLRRIQELDVVTAYEAGLSEASDPELLEWAAGKERVVLTHDRRTMPDHAGDRIRAGLRMFGVVVVPKRLPLGQVIDELELIATCSVAGEWDNRIQFLPLR